MPFAPFRALLLLVRRPNGQRRRRDLSGVQPSPNPLPGLCCRTRVSGPAQLLRITTTTTRAAWIWRL